MVKTYASGFLVFGQKLSPELVLASHVIRQKDKFVIDNFNKKAGK